MINTNKIFLFRNRSMILTQIGFILIIFCVSAYAPTHPRKMGHAGLPFSLQKVSFN